MKSGGFEMAHEWSASSGAEIASLRPEEYLLPPFTYDFGIPVGRSPGWYPEKRTLLLRGWISARAVGTTRMALAFGKDAMLTPLVLLGTAYMDADQTFVPFGFGDWAGVATASGVVATPDRVVDTHEQLYIVSFSDSGHDGVVVQLVGKAYDR
jgi:hypothetical protein